MKTNELTGKALNWAVGKAEGLDGWLAPVNYCGQWEHGGPIIEREELSIEPQYTAGGLECWVAYGHNLRYDDHGNYIQGSDNRQYAPTPLIAAMRCYVASKLGEDVSIPEELA
jgi:hypothetical protein